jgi:type I restriction enzyme, S subunit
VRDHHQWPQIPLRDITLPTSTWNPSAEPRAQITYVDVSAVSRESLAITNPSYFSGHQAPGRARKIIQTGDTIFATIRPSLRRIAKIPSQFDNQLASTAFCVLRPDPKVVDPDFLFFALQTNIVNDRISALQSGASYPAVRDSEVLDQEIPFPELNDQREIARILGFLRSAVSMESKTLENTIALKQAVMTAVFANGLRNEPQRETEIGIVPSSWDVRRFETIREWLQYGTSVPCDSNMSTYPVLRIPNVEAAFVNTADLKYCDLPKDVANRYLLCDGDILFIRTNGVRERLGKCAVYSGDPPKALFALADAEPI